MIKKVRTLLDIELYEATGYEISKIRKTVKHDRFLINEILPKYSIHSENGTIKYTDTYLQWTNNKYEKYLLFDAQTTDKLLDEEIKNCGLDELLKGYDMRYVLETFTKNKLEEYLMLPSEYLIIELSYIGGGYFNADDVTLEVNPIGKLNLNLIDE